MHLVKKARMHAVHGHRSVHPPCNSSLPFNVQHEGQNEVSAAGVAVGACLIFIHNLFVLPAVSIDRLVASPIVTGLDIFVGDECYKYYIPVNLSLPIVILQACRQGLTCPPPPH